MAKVLILERIHDRAYEYLREHGYEIVECPDTNRETIINYAKGCDAMLCRATTIDASLMEAMPSIKIISRHGVGLDTVDLDAAKRLGIKIANTPLSNVNAVAEHTLALILAVMKQIVYMDDLTRTDRFKERHHLVTQELKGKTVAVLGFGKIGRIVAKLVSAFDVNLLVYDPFASEELVASYGGQLKSLDEIVRAADVITIHTPLTEKTKHLIGEEELSKMKKTAFLINASRGPVVDEEALIKALQNGQIAGAGLDVFEEEPPKMDNPLFKLQNVVVSPHSAAFSSEALVDMAYVSAKNIVDFFETGDAEYIVN